MSRGDLSISFNGEIYNVNELRSELQAHGHAFVSRSDTEVALAAFKQWGVAAFARFNGMFALVVVDSVRRRAWFARDRWGKKPLFIARLPRRVLFASELKALLATERAALTLDRQALAKYFRYQYVPGTASIFSEVEKLAPASWLELDFNTWDERRGTWWELPAPAGPETPAEPEEVLATVREAVKRRLIADVPVGAFLSGGTDSSLVVACMKDIAPDCHTFSIGFADPRFDESSYALAVSEHLGTVHTHHILREEDALALIPQFTASYDEPFADSSALPTMAVARLAREDVTVALSGDGGDELFGGYPRYRTGPYLALAEHIPRRAAAVGAPFAYRLPKLGQRLGRLLDAAHAHSCGSAYRELVSIWKTPELQELMPDVDPDDSFADSFDQADGSLLERMMRRDARTYLVDDILQKVDRATMAFSLEARNPLLDPAVAQLAFRSISTAEAKPGRKPLLRATLRLVLPSQLVERPKRGFGVPLGDWLKRELRPTLEDMVFSSSSDHYDHVVAQNLCRDHLDGRRDATHQVWSLLAFGLWRDQWFA